MVRLGLIVRDQLYRAGLSGLLADGRYSVDVAVQTVEEAVAAFGGQAPDMIVLDLTGAGPRLPALVAQLRAAAPAARLVVLAGKEETDKLLEAFRLGVDGTLHRDISPAAFIDSLSVVAAGEPVYPGALLHSLLAGGTAGGDAGAAKAEPSPLASLSKRERTVLRALTEGMENKAIALELDISENTVKSHIRRICRVLNARNRTQAALLGAEYLDPEVPAAADVEPGRAVRLRLAS